MKIKHLLIPFCTLLVGTCPVGKAAQFLDNPVLTPELTVFQCKKSFNGHGIGVCAGRIDISLSNLDRPLRQATFTCQVLITYWWLDGRDKRSELKSIILTAEAERLGARFTSATSLFEVDLTSVAREPKEAVVNKVRCEVDWS